MLLYNKTYISGSSNFSHWYEITKGCNSVLSPFFLWSPIFKYPTLITFIVVVYRSADKDSQYITYFGHPNSQSNRFLHLILYYCVPVNNLFLLFSFPSHLPFTSDMFVLLYMIYNCYGLYFCVAFSNAQIWWFLLFATVLFLSSLLIYITLLIQRAFIITSLNDINILIINAPFSTSQ